MEIIASELRNFLHLKSFEYSTEDYPFKETLENIYGCKLDSLHKFLGQYDIFELKNDQTTLAHKVFYSNFNEKIKPIYERFIKEVILKIVKPNKFYYQVIPTVRIGLPGNKFVGEFHKDSHYNHQSYELNFNLGLSNYLGDAALKTEKSPNSKTWITLECPYGKIFSFDHIDCLHGSSVNKSSKTMVSFDFRLALKDLYFETDASSVNLDSKFKPGYYFSSQCLGD